MKTVERVCTASEVALVKLSRRPAVGRLSGQEASRLASRARKSLDKWHGQERSQARDRNRKSGFGEASDRTSLKTEIFRDALDSFLKQAAKGDQAAAQKRTSKPARTAEHRKSRASVRDELSELKAAKNRQEMRPSENPAAGNGDATDQGTEVRISTSLSSRDRSPGRRRRNELSDGAAASNKEHLRQPAQTRARVVATRNRLLESGVKTRIRGHASAQTRRAQARRDSQPRSH